MKTPFNQKNGKLVSVLALVFGIFLSTGPQTAEAHEYSRDYSAHPLRYLAYPVHAVGIGLEYLVTRPIHYLVSRDDADVLFGHYATTDEDGTYFEWAHGDKKPSVKEERAALRDARQQLERLQTSAPAPAPKPAEPVMIKSEESKPAATAPAAATKPAASMPSTSTAEPVVDVSNQ